MPLREAEKYVSRHKMESWQDDVSFVTSRIREVSSEEKRISALRRQVKRAEGPLLGRQTRLRPCQGDTVVT